MDRVAIVTGASRGIEHATPMHRYFHPIQLTSVEGAGR